MPIFLLRKIVVGILSMELWTISGESLDFLLKHAGCMMTYFTTWGKWAAIITVVEIIQ